HSLVDNTDKSWRNTAFLQHSSLNDSSKCIECHTFTNKNSSVKVRAQALAPHNADTSYHKDRDPLSTAFSKQVACGSCHTEHKGQLADIKTISDKKCQSCHRQKFTSFSQGHPEFTLYPYKGSSAISFNHLGGKSGERFAHKELVEQGKCVNCHQQTGIGKVRVRSFEQMCAICHASGKRELGADKQGQISIELKDLIITQGEKASDFSQLVRFLNKDETKSSPEVDKLKGLAFNFDLFYKLANKEVEIGYRPVLPGISSEMDFMSEDKKSQAILYKEIFAAGNPFTAKLKDTDKIILIENILALAKEVPLTSYQKKLKVIYSKKAYYILKKVKKWHQQSKLVDKDKILKHIQMTLAIPKKSILERIERDLQSSILAEIFLAFYHTKSKVLSGRDFKLFKLDVKNENKLLQQFKANEELIKNQMNIVLQSLKKAALPKLDKLLLSAQTYQMTDYEMALKKYVSSVNITQREIKSSSNYTAWSYRANKAKVYYKKLRVDLQSMTAQLAKTTEETGALRVLLKEKIDLIESELKNEFSVKYQFNGHADPLLKTLYELKVKEKAPMVQMYLDSFINRFTALGINCIKCHQSLETGGVEGFSLWKYEKFLHHYSKYSHQVHKSACSSCHTMSEVQAADIKEQFPYFDSEFVPMTKASCVTCHTAEVAGESCTKCHNYHLEDFSVKHFSIMDWLEKQKNK
ncbi:MAG: hypothetical protein HRT88_08825, partial [Lentisphaeraceae bacterium]|nr:hypothetical protein [Lentisphaeraceae bacterium]